MAAKLSADDPVSLFGTNEQPQYVGLARAVEAAWRETRKASQDLREAMFAACGLEQPEKANKAALTTAQRRALDEAISQFLVTMAGSAWQSETGFSSPDTDDGIIQQLERLSYAVGLERGRELTDYSGNVRLTEAQVENLNREAFRRLSADGRLRFASRLDDIKDGLIRGFREGRSPVEIARSLSRDLDGYERGRLLTICRTEAGLSAIQGQRALYIQAGIREVEVIGDSASDALCASKVGRRFSVNDTENLPLYHPSCFCDLIPISE